MSTTTNFFLLAGAFSLLFLIAEVLHRKFGVSAESTRKLVHVGTGLLTLLFPLLLQSTIAVGLLCGSFLLLLLASMRFGLLPSINAIRRKSWGSLLYPVIVFIVYAYYEQFASADTGLFNPLYYFYTPILVMAVCDPVAALAGNSFRRRYPQTAHGKTLAGSFSFFFASSLLVIGLSAYFNISTMPSNVLLVIGIVIGFISALAERFSTGGWDNFTIPLSVLAGMYIMEMGLINFAG